MLSQSIFGKQLIQNLVCSMVLEWWLPSWITTKDCCEPLALMCSMRLPAGLRLRCHHHIIIYSSGCGRGPDLPVEGSIFKTDVYNAQDDMRNRLQRQAKPRQQAGSPRWIGGRAEHGWRSNPQV